MASKTEICNLALSHLGYGKEIADLDTEQSQEASACRRFYTTAKQAILEDHDWSFATEFATLALIEANPTTEWAFSYRYPTDCLKIKRILSGIRQDTTDTQVPFKLLQDTSGLIIYTDMEDAQIEFIKDVTENYLPAQFNLAFSFRLAAYLAPRITGGDPFKMKEEMLGQYALELQRAKINNMNEERLDTRPESEFIRTRY